MPELIAKELTGVDKFEEKVTKLESEVQKKEIELKQAKVKLKKRPSIGYFRARFKGG